MDAKKRTKLTQKAVETAGCPPGKKDALVFDGETRGFGLRVSSNGAKTFIAQYTIAGRKRRVPIGAFGALTVEGARKIALGILGAAAGGKDPFAERKAATAAAREAKKEAAYTFEALVNAWVAARSGDRRESYLREAKNCLMRNLAGWKKKPASGITLAQAVREIDRIKADKGTIAANRTLAYARAAYGWAAKRQAVRMNPFRGIERAGREAARERVLTLDELGAIWRAAGHLENSTFAAFIRVLLLTLQRRGEVAEMQWDELDNPTNPTTWTIPASRAKNGRAHIVHLPPAASAIIAAQPRIRDNPFVFAASRENKPIAAFGIAKAELEGILAENDEALPDWRLHDFRRAGVTALAGMGFAPHVCDRILNHVTGAIQGVAAIYQRHEFLAERKAALEAWATQVLAAAEGREAADNVVPLARSA